MSDRRYPLLLSCGRTVEIAFRRIAAEHRGGELRDCALYRCEACGGASVQVVACGELQYGLVDCERRCPDCDAFDAGAWREIEFDAYEAHLRAGLDLIVGRLDAFEAERMSTFAEVFGRALREDLIAPDDFLG